MRFIIRLIIFSLALSCLYAKPVVADNGNSICPGNGGTGTTKSFPAGSIVFATSNDAGCGETGAYGYDAALNYNAPLFSAPSISVAPLNASTTGQVITGAASQTADLIEINKSDNTNYFKVGPTGVTHIGSSLDIAGAGTTGITSASTDFGFNAANNGDIEIGNTMGNAGAIFFMTNSTGGKVHLRDLIYVDGNSAPTTGQALCLDASHELGHCTSAVGVGGACTCSAP